MPHKITGEIIDTPEEHKPYRVVFKDEGKIMVQIDVRSREESETVLKAVLEVLKHLANRSPP